MMQMRGLLAIAKFLAKLLAYCVIALLILRI